MGALLMVMNPRAIPEVVDAFEALNVDLCWLTGMYQEELVPVVEKVVRTTTYDHYIICADDCVVTQEAFDAVLGLLQQGHPAATGYCRLDRTHPMVNLCKTPLLPGLPTMESYDWFSFDDVKNWPEEIVPTHFMGMALTGMPRDMWLKYPYQVYGIGQRGWASDFNLSSRLRDDGVPMVAARDGFIDHLKEVWLKADQAHVMRLLIGEIEPEVRFSHFSA
jgi:hypothetical protein